MFYCVFSFLVTYTITNILLYAYTHRRLQIIFLVTNHYKPSQTSEMFYVNRIASCKLSGVKSKIIARPSLQPKAAVVLQNVFSKIAVSTGSPNKILPQTRDKFFMRGNISGTNEINNGRTILNRPSWILILDTHQLTDTNLQQHRRVKFNQACVHVRGIVL